MEQNYKQNCLIFQLNIVAGGFFDDGRFGYLLDTVEVNVAGQNSWRYGFPLPKAISSMRGVTAMSHFYITGGEGDHLNDEDAIQHIKDGRWQTVGYMNERRYGHAVSNVNFDFICSSSSIIKSCHKFLDSCLMLAMLMTITNFNHL